MHLAKGCAQGSREDLEVVEVPLQFGDLDGKLGGTGVEGRDVSLQLVRSRGKAGDLVGNLALEGRAGAAEPQVSPQRADGGEQRDQGSQHYQYAVTTYI